MTILEDTRQQNKKHDKKHQWFEENSIEIIRTKLFCGDYTLPTDQSVCVDTKANLSELCHNACQDHDRFRRELIRAKENGIKLIILCEHGNGIETLEDVIFWENPRGTKRIKVDGKWQTVKTNATTGKTLYNILSTLQNKYDVQFEFCTKEDTGKRIVELLSL